MNKSYKTLYRSRSNRLIGGVAAGIGEYLGIDPTVVRLLFVLIALIGWVAPAVVVYLVMLFVVPEEPVTSATSSSPIARVTPPTGESTDPFVHVETSTPEEAGAESVDAPPTDTGPQI